jgi:hypothetical protein
MRGISSRVNKSGLTAIVLACVLLLAAGLLLARGSSRPPERTFTASLETLLPPAPEGWVRTIRPVAETPEMQSAVNRVLNYDDAVFADYTHGTDRVSIYIAYWTPGKMPYRLVAGHTPDVCWVGNGWRKTSPNKTALLRCPDGRLLPPAEARTFSLSTHEEHVWFWHLVNGKAFSYGTGGLPPWHAMFTDLLRRDLSPRAEQLFIRLSANAELTDSRLRPAAEVILGSLPIP